jgi:hypothetical protein
VSLLPYSLHTLHILTGPRDSRNTGNRTVTVHSQKDPACSLMDPINYILILALRFGIVNGTTIDDIVKDTAKRRDKTIQWLKPECPVLPAYKGSWGVVEGKAAGNRQILFTLRRACELAGMVFNNFNAHDLRRGLARDIAYLPKASRLNTQEAAEALHHSDKAVRQGVTSE